VGITDGLAALTAAGGGFSAGTTTFKVSIDPGSRLIGRWLPGNADLVETFGFRPAGKHNGVAVGANALALDFSADAPTVAPTGAQSLDLSFAVTGRDASLQTMVSDWQNKPGLKRSNRVNLAPSGEMKA
jgi:hypothetical protein